VVGGAGHVGLPLALLLAHQGKRVAIYDINPQALDTIRQGRPPYQEHGAEPLLREALASGRLTLCGDSAELVGIPTFIVTIGTPIDAFLNPRLSDVLQAIEPLLPCFSDGQLLVLRSTVYPGTTDWLHRYLEDHGKRVHVAFCPERVVEGFAIQEIQQLPQIVSGTSPEAERKASELFLGIAPEVVCLRPMEAEFAKLFCNAYRYVQFAVTNQFYMIANSAGLDYYRILEGMKRDYPRMRDFPRAGFAAGPCLFKDTMQLSAFYNNAFSLGTAAMFINESLPLYLVDRLAQEHDLTRLTVGLLGMAFKADSDDPRSSLSYKLKKVLRLRAKRVLTTDPLVSGDPDLLPLQEVIAQSDVLVLCAPHRAYLGLDLRGKPVVDIWNFFGEQGAITSQTASASLKVPVQAP
jgi:UDP-N-acetyl-D-mannosaminuronic acid dehydrogenase